VEFIKQQNSNYRVQQTLGTNQSSVTAPTVPGNATAASPGMVKP
jgi:hypothetical protein